jgi:hypothetical protein
MTMHMLSSYKAQHTKKPIMSSRTQCKWNLWRRATKKRGDTIRRWCCKEVALILIKTNEMKVAKKTKFSYNVHTFLLQKLKQQKTLQCLQEIFQTSTWRKFCKWCKNELTYNGMWWKKHGDIVRRWHQSSLKIVEKVPTFKMEVWPQLLQS